MPLGQISGGGDGGHDPLWRASCRIRLRTDFLLADCASDSMQDPAGRLDVYLDDDAG